MAEQHTDDLRNVQEGDSVTIESERATFDAECTERQIQNADPRSGEVRETKIWIFENPAGQQMAASILDGLKSSPDDPDFPKHSALFNMETSENLGYIEELQIHGKLDE